MNSIKRRFVDRLEFDIECLRADLADPNITAVRAVRDTLDVRGRLGWTVNDLGQAILRMSSRISPNCPSNFEAFFDDGWRYGRDQGRRDIVDLMVESGVLR